LSWSFDNELLVKSRRRALKIVANRGKLRRTRDMEVETSSQEQRVLILVPFGKEDDNP
jgi:hypothetical protein